MTYTIIALSIILSLIAIALHYSVDHSQTTDLTTHRTDDKPKNTSLKAVLIDALYSNYPNEEFTRSLNISLGQAGIGVDVFQGNDVTVDFLKNMTNGYKLIILRMHSALSASNDLYLFTAEPYSADKYKDEQYFRLVKEAYATENSEAVFAVNWAFVKKFMTEKFEGALVVAMGCDGVSDQMMVNEFINQGAIGYIGWNGPVLLSHSDKAILHFIRTFYLEKQPLEAAVEDTNHEVGADPDFGSVFELHFR